MRADPEVAAATFADDLDRAVASDAAARWGWSIADRSPLRAVIRMTAVRADGTADEYFVRLTADWYDQWPPEAVFVRPGAADGEWMLPTPGSRWLPTIQNFDDSSFAFHVAYPFSAEMKAAFPDQTQGQLICCSMSFGYYISSHVPTEGQRWTQGKHTVAALLHRVQRALTAPHYEGRSGAIDT